MKKYFLLILVGILTFGFGLYRYIDKNSAPDQMMCTMEAMECPDGSYVGRSGPSCAFAPCPTVETAGWKITTDLTSNITFQYPETLSTTYINTVDWPPKILVMTEPFTCMNAGKETERAGETQEEQIGNRIYCVTRVVEGAAGSIYTQYSYIVEKGGRRLNLTFTLRQPQCANYDDPKKTECELEISTFNINEIIDKIVSTI